MVTSSGTTSHTPSSTTWRCLPNWQVLLWSKWLTGSSGWQALWANSMLTSSDVPTMKSTTLPMADMMGEFRSSNKGYRDRQLLYDSSPINWSLAYLLMCEPIASIIRISVNFFLYGSNFCFFTALGLIPRVSPCSLRTKDSLCCFGKLSFLTVSQLYIAFRWRNVSVLISMLSCLNAVLSTKFWPTPKQGINKRTINPIDFFGTIIQISIDLFLIRPDKPIVARKTLRHIALLAVDELVDVLDSFVQRAHFAIID